MPKLAHQSNFDNSQVVDRMVVHKKQFAPNGAFVTRPIIAAKLGSYRHRRLHINGWKRVCKCFKSGSSNIRTTFVNRIPVAGSIVYRSRLDTIFEALKKLQNMPKVLPQGIPFKLCQLPLIVFRS